MYLYSCTALGLKSLAGTVDAARAAAAEAEGMAIDSSMGPQLPKRPLQVI